MIGRDKRSFDQEEHASGGNGSVNIISAGTHIEGEIRCKGDLRVDGKVSGRIHSQSKVVIGTTGEVEGDIFCQHADIFGKYTGTMKVQEVLFMKSNCQIRGDVHTGKLVVEAGALFSGNCNMGEAPTAKPAPELRANETRREKGKEVEVTA